MQLALWTSEPATECRVRAARAAPLKRVATVQACTLAQLDELGAEADRYIRDAHAQATRKAYAADWRAFEQWCGLTGVLALPAAPRTLELYLTHLAQLGRKASTIRRARIAIGQVHGHADAARPDRHVRVRTLDRGIGRTHGTREEGAKPLLEDALAKAVATLGRSPREDRDRALLLVGFAGAYRASDLSGLDIGDVRFADDGLHLTLRRSKEDQLGRGAVTHVPFGAVEATCPVRALKRWIGRVGRPAGPLFRVVRGTTIEHERIHPRAVSRAVQRAVERAGLVGDFSAHSLRSGLATSAYAHGATAREIQLQGRWADTRSVNRYIQMERVPGRRNVASGLL